MEKKFLSLDKNTIKKITIGLAVIVIGAYTLNKINIFGTTEVKVAKVEVGALSDMNLYTGMVVPGEVVPVYISAPAVVEKVLVT